MAEVQPVVPGETIENRAIVQAGLQAGEVVVTDGQLRLVNGAKVEVKGAREPAGPGADRGKTGS